jgi:hypothetical protein
MRTADEARSPIGGRREPIASFYAYECAPELIMIFSVGPWGMTESTAKFSSEMSVVAIAAGVGDLADRLACF